MFHVSFLPPPVFERLSLSFACEMVISPLTFTRIRFFLFIYYVCCTYDTRAKIEHDIGKFARDMRGRGKEKH